MSFVMLASAPDHAVGLAQVTKTNNSVQVSWTDNAENEVKYVLQYRATSGGPNDWTTAAEDVPNTGTHTFTGLAGATEYQFRASPRTALFRSDNAANYLTVTTNADPVPATNSPQWGRPAGDRGKGKWRVRPLRVTTDDLFVEPGNSVEDL